MALNQRFLQPGERIRVMVVDDSVVIRRLVTRALEKDPMIEVVGTASNGTIGMQRISQWSPDLVSLDIEMPGMDGLEMLRQIRINYPSLRVVMFSTLTSRGAEITLEALSLGADDYVAKPSHEGSLEQTITRFEQEMIPKVKQFFRFPEGSATSALPVHPTAHPESLHAALARPAAVVIGISTGGPTALGKILPTLPANFHLPILIVQHMPPLFTRFLAERLDAVCALKVEEASQGTLVQPGTILIAPGNFHIKVHAEGQRVYACLDQSAQQNFCRPAVDVLFRSASEVYGGKAVGVILTGMGQDGLRGAELLKARGARILAQDEESSVVWGMPGAVVNAGLADRVLPLDEIVPELLRIVTSN